MPSHRKWRSYCSTMALFSDIYCLFPGDVDTIKKTGDQLFTWIHTCATFSVKRTFIISQCIDYGAIINTSVLYRPRPVICPGLMTHSVTHLQSKNSPLTLPCRWRTVDMACHYNVVFLLKEIERNVQHWFIGAEKHYNHSRLSLYKPLFLSPASEGMLGR